jgi:glycosyltransferase involved in cell wall biosynthesis
MVGRLFFTKGGRSVLSAFKSLYLMGRRDWRLEIVSQLEVGDEESGSTAADREAAKAEMALMSPLVTHTPSLPPGSVLRLFQRSHVALLPSLADTYGYVVLEAQAAGCAVITTNIRALPEINDDSCGWVVKLPIDELGFGAWRSPEARAAAERRLGQDLVEVLLGILGDRDSIAQRSHAALDRISREHDPASTAAKIEGIYMRRFA